MAHGPYYYRMQGAKVVRKQLEEMAREVGGKGAGLKPAYQHIADLAASDVRKHAPMGRPSRKDSAKHLRPGSLKAGIRGHATQTGASVIAQWDGPLILQEFGGKAYWHRYGSGELRGLFGGRAISDLGGGQIGWWETYSSRGRTKARGLSTGATASGHIVYAKPRAKFGYFIWNVAWRLREEIGTQLALGVRKVANDAGLEIEIAGYHPVSGEFASQPWRGNQ